MNFDRINESDIKTKGYNEFVTFVDEEAETAIKDVIQSRYPDHGIIAEESQQKESAGADYVWIIDPLDGTTNYIHSFPVYAVSIALKVKGLLEVAVIYDPSRQELFTAIRGAGRQLDGAPAPFDLVAEVAGAVGGRTEVICDGGIRRGSDIVKAVAAGATATMGGRLFLYALAAAGEAGVDHVLGLLRSGTERTMALVGAASVGDLGPELLERT